MLFPTTQLLYIELKQKADIWMKMQHFILNYITSALLCILNVLRYTKNNFTTNLEISNLENYENKRGKNIRHDNYK